MVEALGDNRLTLIAQEAGEVPLLSALCIGAAVPVVEIGFDRRARRVVLMLRRYRWEAGEPSRVLSALRIDSVVAVRRKHWPTAPAVLELLAFAYEGDALNFAFAGGATLRIEVECPDLRLEDLGPPWAARTPEHD